MGLTQALQIGRSALTAAQAGVQVSSNNLANLATPGYSRQVARLVPIRGVRESTSFYAGRGVALASIQRQVSEALQSRLRTGVSEESYAGTLRDLYSTVEVSLNELTGADLSSELNAFFGAWSERANLTESSAVVVQQGQQLAGFLQRLSGDLRTTRDQIDRDLAGAVSRANQLIGEIGELNRQVVSAELGSATANDLRDQRDMRLEELSQLIDIDAVEQTNGAVNVLVGSNPVVLDGITRELTLSIRSVEGELRATVSAGQNQRELRVTSGRIGALLDSRDQAVDGTLEQLDRLSSQLIFQVNRLHATGTNATGLSSTRATLAFATANRDLALNHPGNRALTDLPFAPANGGFYVHVTHAASGHTDIVRVDIDLDGIRADGTEGFDDDTSLSSLTASLNAIDGLSASIDAEGRLRVNGDEGYTFAFADDSSDVLATLGVNSYFTGKSASDIAVRDDLALEPSRLATGRIVEGEFVENATALGIVALQDSPITALGGLSFREHWQTTVQGVAGAAASSNGRADAASLVRQSLDSQRLAISGVSVDEESLNLLNFQRQYQGAARVITVADELLQTLLSII
ncbi:MAG: flagellar hook-associated protein FlgK [Phycisphaeraceae bacterium]|nr:flagellar hook-associated protein FlgK [Phycisphaeraceae bacterium]